MTVFCLLPAFPSLLDSSPVGDPFQNDPFAKQPPVPTGIYFREERLIIFLF